MWHEKIGIINSSTITAQYITKDNLMIYVSTRSANLTDVRQQSVVNAPSSVIDR